MNLQSIVRNLKPGRSVKIGGDAKCWTTAERSGNGKVVRIVRHTPNGFEVIQTERA